MSEFSKLLKTSRLAQVARPLKHASSQVPKTQVLETRDAALARQEWGIKYALPSKVKSRYLTLTELDSLERLVDFETNGGDHHRRVRFQEMNTVPRLDQETTHNPLFHKTTPKSTKKSSLTLSDAIEITPQMGRKRAETILAELKSMRPELKEELLKAAPEAFNASLNKSSKDFNDTFEKDLATKFVLNKTKDANKQHISSLKTPGWQIAGKAGLSYALKGRVRNSPNGFIQKEVIPGRAVGVSYNAVGGFIGGLGDARHEDPIARTQVRALTPRDAIISGNGSVRIHLDVNKSEISAQRVKRSMRARTPGRNSKDVSDPRLEELLSFIGDTKK